MAVERQRSNTTWTSKVPKTMALAGPYGRLAHLLRFLLHHYMYFDGPGTPFLLGLRKLCWVLWGSSNHRVRAAATTTSALAYLLRRDCSAALTVGRHIFQGETRTGPWTVQVHFSNLGILQPGHVHGGALGGLGWQYGFQDVPGKYGPGIPLERGRFLDCLGAVYMGEDPASPRCIMNGMIRRSASIQSMLNRHS